MTFAEYCATVGNRDLTDTENKLCSAMQDAYERDALLMVSAPRFNGRTWLKEQFAIWKEEQHAK